MSLWDFSATIDPNAAFLLARYCLAAIQPSSGSLVPPLDFDEHVDVEALERDLKYADLSGDPRVVSPLYTYLDATAPLSPEAVADICVHRNDFLDADIYEIDEDGRVYADVIGEYAPDPLGHAVRWGRLMRWLDRVETAASEQWRSRLRHLLKTARLSDNVRIDLSEGPGVCHLRPTNSTTAWRVTLTYGATLAETLDAVETCKRILSPNSVDGREPVRSLWAKLLRRPATDR